MFYLAFVCPSVQQVHIRTTDLIGRKILQDMSHVALDTSVPVAQWAKPLLIGHSACWPDGLRALADLGSNPGLEGGFSAQLEKPI